MDGGLECERLIKEVVVGMGSGLVNLYLLGLANLGRSSSFRVTTAPDIKASEHRK